MALLFRPDAARDAALAACGRRLEIEDPTVRHGGFTALDDVSLAVDAGEIVALLGPSGCGTTTPLRAVAGFVRRAPGQVRLGGQVVDDLPPERRRIGIVFQNYALFPHMMVAENVAYGLRARREPRPPSSCRR